MKENELRQHATCSLCGKKIGHTGIPMFWTACIERHGLKVDALRQQDGLIQMLGGNAALASVMGANEDMTMSMMEPKTITICESCATDSSLPIAAMVDDS